MLTLKGVFEREILKSLLSLICFSRLLKFGHFQMTLIFPAVIKTNHGEEKMKRSLLFEDE